MAQDTFEPARVYLRQDGESFEVRIPDEAVEYYGIEGGTPICFEPELQGSFIVIGMRVSDVDETLATTTRVRQSGETTTWYARIPKPMAVALGLGHLAGGDAQAIVEAVDDGTMRMRTAPAMMPWTGHGGTPSTAVQQLGAIEKPLLAIRTPENRTVPMQFRYDFGVGYTDAYELEAGQDVAMRYGAVDGELALMIDLDPSEDVGYHRTLESYQGGEEGYKMDVMYVHPHKAHVQSLGMGTDPIEEDETTGIDVLAIPGTKEIALLPAVEANIEGVESDDVKQETSSAA